jgi:hypothetical protein
LRLARRGSDGSRQAGLDTDFREGAGAAEPGYPGKTALPDKFTVGGVGPNYAWNPHANIFFASSMGKDTLRYIR